MTQHPPSTYDRDVARYATVLNEANAFGGSHARYAACTDLWRVGIVSSSATMVPCVVPEGRNLLPQPAKRRDRHGRAPDADVRIRCLLLGADLVVRGQHGYAL